MKREQVTKIKKAVKDSLTKKSSGGVSPNVTYDMGNSVVGIALCVLLLAAATGIINEVTEALTNKALSILGS